MHGTFPTEVNGAAIVRRSRGGGAYVVVRAGGRNRSVKLKTALLVAGCCFAALPQSSPPGRGHQAPAPPVTHTALRLAPAATSLAPPVTRSTTPAGPGERVQRSPWAHAGLRPAEVVPSPPVDVPAPAPSWHVGESAARTATAPVLAASETTAIDNDPTVLLAAKPAVSDKASSKTVAAPDDDRAIVQLPDSGAPSAPIERKEPAAAPSPLPSYAVPPEPAPALTVDLPDPAMRPAATPSTLGREDAQELAEQAMRPVDIAQISDSDVRSLRPAQLHEPGLVAGSGPNLAQKIAAMQVTPLPPARLPSSERAKYLAEAPTEMVVRIGATALGKVDFRMTEARTIDVKLSGLLDLLADHYSDAEFARLRNSAAADTYVNLGQLRAFGLLVRYDPVYDEVRIDG